jgi:oligoendopeptidase F
MGNESFKRAAAETGSDAAPPIDLSDYYQGPNDPAIEADMQSVKTAAAGFAAKYKGNLAALSPDELARAYEETDALLDVWTRIGGYSDFIMAMNAQDEDAKALESKIRSFAAETSNLLVFFDLELAKIDEADLHRAIAASPALARYEPAITNLLKNKPHMLSEPEEKILTIADTTGASAWARYFTEKMSRITLPFDGAETDLESILSSTMVADRETRRKAFTGLTEGLARVEFDTTFALNVIAEEKREHDKLRNYAQAPSARNLSNNIEDDVIDALNKSVTSSYARLSHRFYALKAEYMGLAQLEPWDRNAPMAADDEDMTFGEARKLVIDTYTAFSPDMGAIAKEFFDKRWIDATQRKGKAGGAFAMPGPVSIHPLQFINWLD